MILECVFNKIENLDTHDRDYLKEYIHLTEVALEVGKRYMVYGIFFRSNIPWFYICEEDSDEYPHPHFCGFFKVINAKVSHFWKIYYSLPEKKITHILPEIWGDDLLFYENLVNGNHSETLAFKELKISMDNEENFNPSR